VTAARRAIGHLRIYESTQILAPGLFGILTQGSVPSAGLAVAYATTYWCHVLSVYSYNDLCDWESDAANPRKAADAQRSRRWIRNQTALLTAIFLAGAWLLPWRVLALLAVAQIVCMAYSDPRIRLKGLPLGGESAHFAAGYCYFLSGVLLAGGEAIPNQMGGLLFGLLYVTGGTFNEIMDRDPDRVAKLRHIVIVAGRRPVLHALFAVHYTCIALVYLYEPGALLMVVCPALALAYFVISRRVAARLDDPRALLRFRRGYRVIFALLLVLLSAAKIRASSAGGGSAGEEEIHETDGRG